MIVSDMIGQFQAFTPEFVKKYAHVAQVITEAMKEYVAEVRSGSFPADEHCYHMIKGEGEKFKELIKRHEYALTSRTSCSQLDWGKGEVEGSLEAHEVLRASCRKTTGRAHDVLS